MDDGDTIILRDWIDINKIDWEFFKINWGNKNETNTLNEPQDLINELFCSDASDSEKLISVDDDSFACLAFSDKEQEENELYIEKICNYKNPKTLDSTLYL
jgi:hypothetical protein